jgi:DNA-binding NtrC family response regulator
MLALYEQAHRAARSLISVLILGETGVGKEVLARTVHARSPRAAGPYIEINCAALPPSLLEGELFGHEKNAFTGANQARPGLLESADGGTVFLDEIGELPLAFQVTLLRVLQERKILRVGGRAPRPIDVRFISATNRDLNAEIARGTFRQDLYFRLNGMSLVIPPLRERASEIAPLVEKFLVDACRQIDRADVPRISPEASSFLQRYPWPGNVRELQNVIERAVVLCTGDTLLPEDLPAHMTGALAGPGADDSGAEIRAGARASSAPVREGAPKSDSGAKVAGDAMERMRIEMKAVERQRIVEALEQSAGNQTRAAELLGMSLRTLVNRLKEYDLPRPRKKP